MPTFSNKSVNLSNYIRLWTKKSTGCPFSDFIPKITAVIPMLCQKNVHSRKTICSHAHMQSKNLFFFKNTALSYHFFFIFHEKPTTVRPIFGQKHENSVKTTQYYGPKKLIGCPMLSCAYFQKTSIL